ncbi:hypothetical protein [uncultured Acidaminococcus sp.]|uniref:Flp family type IVb pilin n=1 Tax=uncultured Acidaminococcus sp. TaxID=352152 RepID=UPI00294354D2|nr:hypothetical protein [uncultured Acidaminococcus sp.]
MRRQKGQDIIEYALMLAIIVGLGWMVYSHAADGGLPSSINSVFNNASALLGEASKKNSLPPLRRKISSNGSGRDGTTAWRMCSRGTLPKPW